MGIGKKFGLSEKEMECLCHDVFDIVKEALQNGVTEYTELAVIMDNHLADYNSSAKIFASLKMGMFLQSLDYED